MLTTRHLVLINEVLDTGFGYTATLCANNYLTSVNVTWMEKRYYLDRSDSTSAHILHKSIV